MHNKQRKIMKISLRTAALICISALAFSGCSNAEPQAPAQQASQDKGDFRCKQDGVLAPEFTCNPYKEGMITALGIAPMNAGNDKAFQRAEAMANARSALARQLEVKVSTLMKTFKGTTGAGASATFDKATSEVSKQVASQTLQGSRQIGMSWTNPQTKELFILVGVETPKVKKELEESIKTSFKNDEALYQQFLAKQASGELEKELEKSAQ